MNKLAWLKTAFAAILGGAVAGATASAQSGNVSGEAIGTSAAAGAATVVIAYLMKSPKK
jgi:hypothetical protein